ncbi:MAG: ABC transporter permease, partial [Betaproteobacteria bacterium]
MTFLPVLLWSDVLIWLLVLAALVLGALSSRNPLLCAAWRRVGRNRPGMAAATVLLAFVLIGLLDSLHYRPRLENKDANQPVVYTIEVLSALDALASPLRLRNEKTYSQPLATRAYAKESIEVREADGSLRVTRDFPRLKFGGAWLGPDETQRESQIVKRVLLAEAGAALIFSILALGCTYLLARRQGVSMIKAGRGLWLGESEFAWNAVLLTLGILLLTLLPVLALCVDFHVFGTDKVGQDVFYQILKSVRTALVIGLVTTLVTLPLAILLGLLAGYFRGWVDDLIQYLYTTLSSIPGVLLIAAAVLMMQVIIDTHPQWFATAAERADLRLLALCFILGMTSWTGLCRL